MWENKETYKETFFLMHDGKTLETLISCNNRYFPLTLVWIVAVLSQTIIIIKPEICCNLTCWENEETYKGSKEVYWSRECSKKSTVTHQTPFSNGGACIATTPLPSPGLQPTNGSRCSITDAATFMANAPPRLWLSICEDGDKSAVGVKYSCKGHQGYLHKLWESERSHVFLHHLIHCKLQLAPYSICLSHKFMLFLIHFRQEWVLVDV